MHLPQPLTRGRLERRYKRFLADVTLEDGRLVTAHCANPGSMIGLADPGLEVWLSWHDNPKRKLPWSLELARLPDDPARGLDGSLVGLNTSHPNRIAAEAIAAGQIAELAGYDRLRPEVRYGANSRIDLLLEADDGRPPCYVEIKNVHLRRPDGPHPSAAEFPDAVTARGTKHLRDLADRVAAGDRAVMLYLVQRQDCDHFRVAADIDPAYAAGLAAAVAAGVETICYACRIDLKAIEVSHPLPLAL